MRDPNVLFSIFAISGFVAIMALLLKLTLAVGEIHEKLEVHEPAELPQFTAEYSPNIQERINKVCRKHKKHYCESPTAELDIHERTVRMFCCPAYK